MQAQETPKEYFQPNSNQRAAPPNKLFAIFQQENIQNSILSHSDFLCSVSAFAKLIGMTSDKTDGGKEELFAWPGVVGLSISEAERIISKDVPWALFKVVPVPPYTCHNGI